MQRKKCNGITAGFDDVEQNQFMNGRSGKSISKLGICYPKERGVGQEYQELLKQYSIANGRVFLHLQ